MLLRLWRRLPSGVRTRVWRGLDRLGAMPVRLAAGPAAGLTILVPASRRRGYRRGAHERAVLELLADRLEPGMQFVDAGAFLGYFTLAAAALVGEEGRVWAFEPSPESRLLLERSVRRNLLANVTVVPLALGERVGGGLLRRSANAALDRLAPPGSVRVGGAEVEITTLDAWCAASGARPDLVKIDVEGGEHALLEGAAGTLRRHRPLLVVEAHRGLGLEPPELLLDRLDAAGYEVRPLTPAPGGGPGEARTRLAALPLAPERVAVLHLLARPR